MRGASAIQDVAAAFPDAPLRLLVVWEPVIATDVAPPTTSVLARISDGRARQFFDEGRIVSREILRSILADPDRRPEEHHLDEDSIVWDYVALFPPGVLWEGAAPAPAFEGAPVVEAAAELRGRLEGTWRDAPAGGPS